MKGGLYNFDVEKQIFNDIYGIVLLIKKYYAFDLRFTYKFSY